MRVAAAAAAVVVVGGLRDLKDELEVERLPRVDDVDEPVGLLLLRPVPNGGEVAGVVGEAPAGLDDDERDNTLGLIQRAKRAGGSAAAVGQRLVSGQGDDDPPAVLRV